MQKSRLGRLGVMLVATAIVTVVPERSIAEGIDSPARPDSLAVCDAHLQSHPAELDSYRCYQRFARRRGQFDLAIRHVERLRRLTKGDPRARLVLAALLADQGQDRAETLFRSAIGGLSQLRDAPAQATAYLMLSSFLMKRGRLSEAAAELGRAKTLLSTVDDEALLAQLTIAEGSLAYRRNDYGQAWSLLKQAEAGLPSSAPAEVTSALLSSLGAVSWATGRVQDAVGYYTRQAVLLHDAGSLYEEASARINLTLLSGASGQPREPLARAALAIAEAGGNLAVQARAHFYLSETAAGPKRLDHARRSLALSRQVQDASGVQMALRAVASASLDADAAGAFSAIQEAIDLARDRGDLAEGARNALVRSRMRWKVGTREQAIADSVAALDAIDAERRLQPDGLDRARRVDMWRLPYAELVARVLSPGAADGRGRGPTAEDLDLAFVTMERGRARRLLDHLDRAGPGGAPDAPAFPSLDEIRRTLRADEALLEFQIWAPGQMPDGVAAASWLLVTTRDATRAFALPRADVIELVETTRLFTGLVQRRDGSESAAASRLFERFFGAALDGLPPAVTRLVIVPDTTVHDLPLDLLRAPAGHLLGTRYDVSIAPSATTWWRWRARASTAPLGGAVAFVDPEPGTRGSPSPGRQVQALPAGIVLGSLPYAKREGAAIVRHVAGPHRVLVGRDATEAMVKRDDLGAYGLLHFAAHAVVDDDHPERSAVLLAPGSDDEDGWLRPSEIEGLSLGGKVIVLSACRGANGTLLRGEGLAGLADAFFRAGAHVVVASLWPLRDDEAAWLFESFYRHLDDGLSVASALSNARRDRAAAGAPAAAWAGVIAIGDGGIVVRPGHAAGRSRTGAIAFGATLCLAAAILLLRFRR